MTHVDSDQWCLLYKLVSQILKQPVRKNWQNFHEFSVSKCMLVQPPNSIPALGQPNGEHPTNSGLLHFAIDPYEPGPFGWHTIVKTKLELGVLICDELFKADGKWYSKSVLNCSIMKNSWEHQMQDCHQCKLILRYRTVLNCNRMKRIWTSKWK